jgi:hypothetical protein
LANPVCGAVGYFLGLLHNNQTLAEYLHQRERTTRAKVQIKLKPLGVV